MTLRQRLLLATALLTIATTFVMGFFVREAWRRAEASRFELEFRDAVRELEREVDTQVGELHQALAPLCESEPTVDSALVGLRAGDLDQRRLSVSLRVPSMMRANDFDELSLLTSSGEILGQGHREGTSGRVDPSLLTRVRNSSDHVTLRPDPFAFEASCQHGKREPWVALLAARHVEPLLASASVRHGLSLRLISAGEDDEEPSHDALRATIEIAAFGGHVLVASRARSSLADAIRQLDLQVAAVGGGTILLALVLAFWLSQGLARPVVDFASAAREVVRGDPRPIAVRGGPELSAAAQAFNQTLDDLVALRQRLAATERIAARREVARQVAHEIKNPLAPIRASVETLRRLRAREDERFDEYFDEATRTVLSEVARIDHIVSEFTRYARLPEPKLASCDVLEVAESVVGLHQAQGIPLELHRTPCPDVMADRDQLVQVLTNLIQNAQDAARHQTGPAVRVTVGPLGADARNVVFLVEDNGPGVPEAERARLFEPYVTTKAHGTGLGLAIVQRIAVEHGGDASYLAPDQLDAARSRGELPGPRPLGGACFVVTIPVGGPPRLPS